MPDTEAAPDDTPSSVAPRREAVTMALYVSIVLLATLVALPTAGASQGDPDVDVVHHAHLIGLIWGEVVGLSLAHVFAFRLTARDFGAGHLSSEDRRVAVAQVLGAVAVAALSTVPVLLVGDEWEVQVTMLVPAVIIGVAGYDAAAASGRSTPSSVALGGFYLALGLVVALVKMTLVNH